MHYGFFSEGEPVAQSRPRFTTRGGYPRAVDTDASRDYKDYIYEIASKEFEKHGRQMLEGSVELRMIVYRPIPQSWSNRKKNLASSGIINPTTIPDLDNYIKIVLDGIGRKHMPKIIFNNDSQITSIYAIKKYASDNPNSNFYKVGIRVVLSDMTTERSNTRGLKV